MADHSREDTSIEVWCEVVGRMAGCRVVVVERPDRKGDGVGGSDAIVDRCGVRQAVEHTTIDSYRNRRQDNARFQQVLAPIAEQVQQRFPDSWIEVIVPVHAVRTGEDWDGLRERFLTEVIAVIEATPIASPNAGPEYTDHKLPGIPFPVAITRQPLDGDQPTCIIGRDAPSDRHDQLVANITSALEAKARQLKSYRDAGLATVLLLDFDDLQLLNYDLVAAAFVMALKTGANDAADEVYVIDRRRKRRIWVLPVKLNDRLHPVKPEFEAYRHAQFKWTWPSSR
jgi:hypothetical protein